MTRPAPVRIALADPAADRVRRNVEQRLTAIEALPFATARRIANVQLVDGVTTPIAHGLGRAPSFVIASVPRGAAGAGYIVEVRDAQHDRASVVQLAAHSYGATITVDVVVA